MVTWLILLLAVLLLGGLLIAENQLSTKGMLLTKPLLSALFVAMVLFQPHQLSFYFYMILGGLLFCWVGDVSLIFFSNKKLFMLGLVSFLIGHIFYALAFFTQGGWTILSWIGFPAILLLSGYVFVRLKPFLESMLGPVLAYIVVISFMLLGAVGLAGNQSLPLVYRVMTGLGAFSFYVSDVFVARQRFVKQEFINRFLGLILYYVGQFLIAIAAGGLS